jgi:hypothetical protein
MIVPAQHGQRDNQCQKDEREKKLFHWWAYQPVLTCRAI